MGLSMSVIKRYHWDHYGYNESRCPLEKRTRSIDGYPIDYVQCELLRWCGWENRWLHQWFISRSGSGPDDCREREMKFEVLVELRDLLARVVKKDNPYLITPGPDLHPGSIKDARKPEDSLYWDSVRDTLKELNLIVEKEQKIKGDRGMVSFQYDSSW